MIKIIIISLLIASAIASPSPHHHPLARAGHGFSARSGPHGLLARQGCSTGEVPCGDGCISSDESCCPDGGFCPAGYFCWPTGGFCCKPGEVVCGIGCMPPGSA